MYAYMLTRLLEAAGHTACCSSKPGNSVVGLNGHQLNYATLHVHALKNAGQYAMTTRTAWQGVLFTHFC
jgi:hypothetical protein